MPIVVAPGDRIIAESAGSHIARHCCQTNQIDQRNGRAACNGRNALVEINGKDDRKRAFAHRFRRLNQTMLHMRQCGFHLPGEKGN